MLLRLVDTPNNVLGLDARGVVTKRDYQLTFEPAVDQAWRNGTRLRLLYLCGPRFTRLTAGALWADARLGPRYLQVLDGCAVVTDIGWIRRSTRGIGASMPCPVRVFGNHERDEAMAWLAAIAELSTISAPTMALAYLGGAIGAIGSLATWPLRGRQ